jgi:hypothetical protein
MSEWKEGDVFFWCYNEQAEKARGHGDNGGTTYWAVSQIGIVDKNGWLVDTFWHGSDNRAFNKGLADVDLELTFKGNINDYRKGELWEQACYSDADCLNLNHANSSKGNFYIRKDAVHNQDKKRKVIQRSKKYLAKEIEYQLRQIRRYQEILETKSYEEMQSISYESEVSLDDEHWSDYE